MGTVGLQNFCKQRFVRLYLPNGIKAKAEFACIIFHLFMSTYVYVLQRLKALGDGENEATILHWTLWESALNAYCSEVQ